MVATVIAKGIEVVGSVTSKSSEILSPPSPWNSSPGRGMQPEAAAVRRRGSLSTSMFASTSMSVAAP